MVDGQTQPVEAVQNLIASLRREVSLRDEQIARMTVEIDRLHRAVGDRNRDVDQLRSVLDQKYEPIKPPTTDVTNNNSATATSSAGKGLESVSETAMEAEDGSQGEGFVAPLSKMLPPPPPPPLSMSSGVAGGGGASSLTATSAARVKKQGVSGESVSRNTNVGFIHYEKDERCVLHLFMTLFTFKNTRMPVGRTFYV